MRPFPFEGRFGFKRHAQPPTAANSAPVTNSCYQYEHDADCVAEDDPSSTEGYAEDEDAAEQRERREAEEDERREREMDASSMESAGYTPEEIERVTGIKLADEEDVVTNGCNQHQHTPGCMKFAVLKKNKGSRSSKGNPKQFRIKSNTPLKAALLAKPQAQVDATEHALKTREGGGGVVKGAAWVKGKRLDVKGGSSDTGGASHMTKHYKPGDTSRRKAAKDTILGRKQKDRTEVASVGKKNKVILADKGDHLEPVTTRRKTDND